MIRIGFRWKCVLKSMFILLFTRINNEQSSIVSKISIYLATHVQIYFIRWVEVLFLNNKKVHNVECYEKSTPVMRLCNYWLINAIVFLIKMLVECKYYQFNGILYDCVIRVLISTHSIYRTISTIIEPSQNMLSPIHSISLKSKKLLRCDNVMLWKSHYK